MDMTCGDSRSAVGIDQQASSWKCCGYRFSRILHGDAVGIDLAGLFMKVIAATEKIDG